MLFQVLAAKPAQSLYVPMPDGVKLAVEVRMPDGWKPGRRVPAILRSTRYWRISPHPDPFPAAG